MKPAHHHIQLADHIVSFNDPVDRLGAFEQQDDVAMQRAVVLQGPYIHDDIHLESTAEREGGRMWRVRST